jgi:hypothetical protein
MFQLIKNMFGMGERAALNYASEALPQMDSALLDPPSWEDDCDAAMFRHECLHLIDSLLECSERIVLLGEDIEELGLELHGSVSGDYGKSFDHISGNMRCSMDELKDALFEFDELILDCSIQCVGESGVWAQMDYLDMTNTLSLVEPGYLAGLTNKPSDDVLLEMFFPSAFGCPEMGL